MSVRMDDSWNYAGGKDPISEDPFIILQTTESHLWQYSEGFMWILAITVKAIKDYLLKGIEIQCYWPYYLITNFWFYF